MAVGANAGLSLAYRGFLDVEATYPDDATNRWSALSYTTQFIPSASGNSTRYGVYGKVTIPAVSTLNSSSGVRGVQNTIEDLGSGNIAGFYGNFTYARANGSGTKGDITGMYTEATASGTVSATSVRGLQMFVTNTGTATTTTAVGITEQLSNAGTLTNMVGLSIGGTLGISSAWTNSGTITNCTALLIGTSTNIGTNKKAIDCQSTADSSFMGKVGFGTATPSALVHALGTTEQLRLGYDAANYASFTVNATGQVKLAAPLTWRPPASYTPASNGDLTVEATSNTSLTFRLKGTDGTVRSAALTLS